MRPHGQAQEEVRVNRMETDDQLWLLSVDTYIMGTAPERPLIAPFASQLWKSWCHSTIKNDHPDKTVKQSPN